MTTHETSFFRDRNPFEFMEETFFPNLLKEPPARKRLGIWSAACSSGQEIYSISMIIHQLFPDLLKWDLDFHATDISEPVLNKARKGSYSQLEVNRGLPMSYLIRYFSQGEDNSWNIKEKIKDSVEFSAVNLIEPWPNWAPFQVIFMRNVLIFQQSCLNLIDALRLHHMYLTSIIDIVDIRLS